MTFPQRDLSSSGGWTCPLCGELMPDNTYHICGIKTAEWFSPVLSAGETIDIETKALLERIAIALEKIASKMSL